MRRGVLALPVAERPLRLSNGIEDEDDPVADPKPAAAVPIEAAAKRRATSPSTSSLTMEAAKETSDDLPPLPDRLSVDPRSPHHVAALMEHDIGVRFNGAERTDVEEYCISEGWIRVPAGRTLDRKGNPLLLKLKGKVEVFYRAGA